MLDEFIAREGSPIGPLHGLPISLKVRDCSQVDFGYFQNSNFLKTGFILRKRGACHSRIYLIYEESTGFS